MSLLFIFDMDDVLYDYDWRARMAGMTRMTGHSLDELRRRWWTAEGELAAEAGGFATGADYLAAMTVRPEALEAVRRAAELGTVTLLTNNGSLTAQHLPTLAPELVEIFGEHLLTSSDYGARKPDPVVFTRVLDAYAVPPERAFFADDMPENVAGAASVGITAHLYSTAGAMRAAIEEFAAAR
jgi:HAD superfamily hydrolase (TIGR01509 family)